MYNNIKALNDDWIFDYDMWYKEGHDPKYLVKTAQDFLSKKYKEKEESLPDPKILRQTEKAIYLQTIDMLWMEHINNMQRVREATSLSWYWQRDPLLEYKHQGFETFKKLLENISRNTISTIFKARIEISMPAPQIVPNIKMETNEKEIESQINKNQINSDVKEIKKAQAGSALKQAEAQEFARLLQNQWNQNKTSGITTIKADDSVSSPSQPISSEKVGRNDPCTCGSGKKYKKCCGS